MNYDYPRAVLNQLKDWLNKGKVIMLYGARQVGKTTLCTQLAKEYEGTKLLNCERATIKEILESDNLEQIYNLIKDSKITILDEAQKIKNIGSILKLVIDTYPNVQLIATGSSSFDLSNRVAEPLTGRNIKFFVYPLSLSELSHRYQRISLTEKLEDFLRFGLYPDIVDRPEKEKIELLSNLATDYLYKDVLAFENLKNPDLLMRLLKSLALQLGSEVSFRELSNHLTASVATIQRYITLLEQSFVLFKLSSFSRNLRKELTKSNKYYFYDLGIRNSLIQNYAPLQNRTDTGALWENFCIVERMKLLQQLEQKANFYFWRTYDQKEIDFIEEREGKLTTFEFKWSPKKTKIPTEFLETYPDSTHQVIDKTNFWEFLLPPST